MAAGQEAGGKADLALAELCRAYWYPVYAFARRKGRQPADAQDLAQAFFSHLIESRLVRKADPEKGRFRSFLLGCFTVFLASEDQWAQALKRGGAALLVGADLDQVERRYAAEEHRCATPEQLFDRHWAVATLEAALARLEAEATQAGRAALFRQLLPALQGDPDRQTYAQLAAQLGSSEATLRVTVNRLRRRYRELIRALVSQTLNNPMDVDTELEHLMAALRS